MPGPFPYAPIQYTEQQTQLFSGPTKIGVRDLWDIQSRLPQFFASGLNKGATSFWMGAAVARDSSGSGFVLANNASVSTMSIGLACLGAPPGQPEIVQLAGLFSLDDWTPVTGSSSLSSPASFWLSSTNGKITTSPPASPSIEQLLGISVSPRTLLMNLEPQSISAFGEIFVENNAVALILVNQNQFYVVTPGWTTNHAVGFTGDTANNRLICNVAGTYQLSGVIDFSGPSNQTFEFAVFVNGVQQGHITAHSQPRGAGQFICTTIIGLHHLVSGDTIDLRAQCDSAAGQSITVVHANLGATKII